MRLAVRVAFMSRKLKPESFDFLGELGQLFIGIQTVDTSIGGNGAFTR